MIDTEARTTHDRFILPATVVSRADVSRLVNEAERVDNEMTANSVREKIGSEAQALPAMTQQLSDFIEQNGISLEKSHDRSNLVKELRALKENVQVIHMTFAVETDLESLQELVSWVRSEIEPQAVIATGIQPSLVAGVYVRTPNHVHDLSLRAALKGRRDAMVKELEALRGGK